MCPLVDPDYRTVLLLYPPVPPCCPGPSLSHTRPAAPSWTPTAEPESGEAGDVGAGTDGPGAAAPGGPRPPERADKHWESMSALPHPAAGGFLHRPARWEWESPHCITWLSNGSSDMWHFQLWSYCVPIGSYEGWEGGSFPCIRLKKSRDCLPRSVNLLMSRLYGYWCFLHQQQLETLAILFVCLQYLWNILFTHN